MRQSKLQSKGLIKEVDAKLLQFLSKSQGLTEEQQAQLDLSFGHLYFVSIDLKKGKVCYKGLP